MARPLPGHSATRPLMLSMSHSLLRFRIVNCMRQDIYTVHDLFVVEKLFVALGKII